MIFSTFIRKLKVFIKSTIVLAWAARNNGATCFMRWFVSKDFNVSAWLYKYFISNTDCKWECVNWVWTSDSLSYWYKKIENGKLTYLTKLRSLCILNLINLMLASNVPMLPTKCNNKLQIRCKSLWAITPQHLLVFVDWRCIEELQRHS